jgi:hypothetical protein
MSSMGGGFSVESGRGVEVSLAAPLGELFTPGADVNHKRSYAIP